MTNTSIRKFADSIETNKTAVIRAMTALNISGTVQGKGKPTLLSESERSRIEAYLFPERAHVVKESQLSIIPADSSESLVKPDSVKVAKYELTDKAEALETTKQQALQTFGQFLSNSNGLSDVFLKLADMQGEELGTQFIARKYQKASETANDLEQQMGKQAGVSASNGSA